MRLEMEKFTIEKFKKHLQMHVLFFLHGLIYECEL